MADIQRIRMEVEDCYLGFRPNTKSIKPVHIANGLFKGLTGKKADVKKLYSLIYTGNAKGDVTEKQKTKNVYNVLKEDGVIDSSAVSIEKLSHLRSMGRKIISADGAVFGEGMVSFTAAHVQAIGTDTIAQDGGELIAYAIKRLSPDLANTLKQWINDSSDLISTLFLPVLSNDLKDYELTIKLDEEATHYLNNGITTSSYKELNQGMINAFNCLNLHFRGNTNKLAGLRLFILFGCFWLVRQLASAEGIYCGSATTRVFPLLMDFSNNINEPIAKASMMNYTLLCQSISRFYAKKLGERLRDSYSIDDLLNEETPKYKGKEANADVWRIAKEDVAAKKTSLPEEDLYTIFGAAVYDMLALEASSNPIACMRNLGIKSGIFYPPSPNPPTKRFRPNQDTFEAIIRSVVEPGEVLNIATVLERLWTRLGIIVGGRTEDERILHDAGIYQIDRDALSSNNMQFIQWLKELDFARIMADGVLQIRLGE